MSKSVGRGACLATMVLMKKEEGFAAFLVYCARAWLHSFILSHAHHGQIQVSPMRLEVAAVAAVAAVATTAAYIRRPQTTGGSKRLLLPRRPLSTAGGAGPQAEGLLATAATAATAAAAAAAAAA